MPNSLPSPLRPETLHEATSINMDRITQLQQSIDRDPQKFKSEQQEIVHDICTNAKQIELLIAALPGINRSESEQIATFKALEQELQEANEEYQRSIQNAESLLKQILDTISIIAKDQSSSTFE
ncbi:4113_t:CDS:2 [Acaulospora morrowiae]|uniref:Mediator of RNA polymerase II transcription subunit 21 n=1 Tax=Acaulospora morrowiae TaxID=94023 RepID=A0A9N8Z7N2_9GLOM|nr:4113_t:CDS:2 [Acaulospora morrowiae]